MEEIEGRFELIRIAVHLGDYEVIDTQIRRLRNMSTDKHLHAILYELESKNFRQALYMMKDYAETLQDDFFNPSVSETAASPTHSRTASTPLQTQHLETVPDAEPSPVSRPTAPEPDLFNLASPAPTKAGEGHSMTLDEMLAMTKESATDSRRYQASEPVAKSDPEAEAPTTILSLDPKTAEFMVSEPAVSSSDPDPLFTLDQDIASEPEPTPPSEIQEEETVSSSPMEMTPLFGGGDDLNLEDDSMPFSSVSDEKEAPAEVSDMTEEPVDAMATESDTGIFALEESEFFEGETLVTQETEPADESVSAPMIDPVPLNAESAVPSATLAEEISLIEEPAVAPEPTEPLQPTSVPEEVMMKSEPEPDAVPPEIVEEDSRPRRWEFELDEDDLMYEKFSYMGQKFRIMMHRYPLKEEVEKGVIDEVQDFIHLVSVRDYAESQVVAAITRYQELKEHGRIGEAGQMLIAAATTESKFAQFMLARELFKGEVLQQDFPESFTQINRLAEEDYPEAICDLGQLYEYGIGIDKNKQHALLLYEEAAQMGVERAQRHYDRLRGSNPLQSIKSLTSALLRKKK